MPWRDGLTDTSPVIENGKFILPTRPGRGDEASEAAVRARRPEQ